MLIFKNDNQELMNEFYKLRSKNIDLYHLIEDLEVFVDSYFQKNVVITMVFRSQEKQDEIYQGTYRKDRSYDKKPWRSPHQFWHSVDIRSHNFNEDEIDKIEKFLNENGNDTNYYKWTAKNHEVNNGGEHFHIQYIRKA